MTYQEAVEAMTDGKRVKHEAFTAEEFFEMQHGVIIDEFGYNMTDWYRGWRDSHEWQNTGWSVI